MSVYICPVCGSPMLKSRMITSISQTPDGEWKMDEFTSEDISEIIDPNVECYCTNQFCGTPMDPYTGRSFNSQPTGLELEGEDAFYDYYNFHHMSERKKYSECSEEEKNAYLEWKNEIYYTPWEGVIGDCGKI